MQPWAMRKTSLADQSLNRRHFLTWAAVGAVVGLGATPALPGQSVVQDYERSVAFYHLHTGESLKTVYWIQGRYLPEALAAIDQLFRDYRTDEIKPIDPQLLDLLNAVREELDPFYPFHIVSGYRSPATNAYLRRRGRGVAKHSLHMEGKAVDLRVPGRDTSDVRAVAMALQGGGVGYYPRADFVHIDVGRIRYW